jgi:phosphate-selective porin OprO and OprP
MHAGSRYRVPVVAARLTGALLFVPALGAAQGVPVEPDAAQPPGLRLDPQAGEQSPPSPDGPRPVSVTWDGRPSLRLWNGAVRIDLRARVQLDVASANHASNVVDEVDFRQHRIGVSGSVGSFVEFEIEREVRSLKGWRDVFVDVRLGSPASVQGGRFKMPFSLDQLTSSAKLDFVSRSLAARWLSPSRDVGVMFHGRAHAFGGPRVGYELGFFRGGGENAPLGPESANDPEIGGTANQHTAAGRLLVSPFDRAEAKGAARRSKGSGALRSLRFGVAATAGEVPEGANSARGQDSFGKSFFPRLDVNGRRTRVGLEASWKPGRASLRAELMQMRDERRGQGLSGANLPSLVATGWYVQSAWTFIRGGPKGGGIGRWIGRGGIGDVEVAVRLERLRFGSDAPSGEPEVASPRAANVAPAWDTALTLGVNWQPIPLARIQLNVVRDEVGGTAWTKRYTQPLVWGIVSRFQIAF